MRTLLLHVASGYSLRETVAVAKESGLATISDVALLNRFKAAGPWFRDLSYQLLKDTSIALPDRSPVNMILVDATHVKEPGKTGSCWKIHYAFEGVSLSCHHFSIMPDTGANVGETYRRFPVTRGDCLVGDRAYSKPKGIAYVDDHGGYVLARYSPWHMKLYSGKNRRLALSRVLANWPKKTQHISRKCAIQHPDGGMIKGRLIVARRSQAAAQAEIKRIKRKAARKQYTVNPLSIEHAQYVMVFTTLPESQCSDEYCLKWYRLRWQIELVFKRLKSLAKLGHLPKHDPESAQAWLYGKLFVGLLTERLIRYGEAISPWGYPMSWEAEAGEPVA
ncbi:MAG: IS4-like element IS421 family transposase [Wenzhouxiangellaceae bacterium]